MPVPVPDTHYLQCHPANNLAGRAPAPIAHNQDKSQEHLTNEEGAAVSALYGRLPRRVFDSHRGRVLSVRRYLGRPRCKHTRARARACQ
jgi:hypothetical protein